MPRRSTPPTSRAGSARPDAQATTSGTESVQVRRALSALSLGALSVAVIGGLACYAVLLGWGVPGWLAAGIGLVFALLARAAMVGLGRDWLLAQARMHGDRARTTPRDTSLDQPGKRR